MASMKRGRDPFFIQGVGSIGAVILGLCWIGVVSATGAPAIFPLLGLFFVGVGVLRAVYSFLHPARAARYRGYEFTWAEGPHANYTAGDSRGSGVRGTGASANQLCRVCGQPPALAPSDCPKCGADL